MCSCKECDNPPCIDKKSADRGTHVLFNSCEGHTKSDDTNTSTKEAE